jgi:hypothetical protein
MAQADFVELATRYVALSNELDQAAIKRWSRSRRLAAGST